MINSSIFHEISNSLVTHFFDKGPQNFFWPLRVVEKRSVPVLNTNERGTGLRWVASRIGEHYTAPYGGMSHVNTRSLMLGQGSKNQYKLNVQFTQCPVFYARKLVFGP